MAITGLNNVYGKQGYERTGAVKYMAKPKAEKAQASAGKVSVEGNVQETDSIEISQEGRLAVEQDRESQSAADSDAVEQGRESQSAADSDAVEQDGESQSAADSDVVEQDGDEVSEQGGGAVRVNEGKRSRQIAAARSKAQIRQVLALLQEDMQECRAGLEKGWCDESEIAKVEALLSKAKARMGQLPEETEDVQDDIAFNTASLL